MADEKSLAEQIEDEVAGICLKVHTEATAEERVRCADIVAEAAKTDRSLYALVSQIKFPGLPKPEPRDAEVDDAMDDATRDERCRCLAIARGFLMGSPGKDSPQYLTAAAIVKAIEQGRASHSPSLSQFVPEQAGSSDPGPSCRSGT